MLALGHQRAFCTAPSARIARWCCGVKRPLTLPPHLGGFPGLGPALACLIKLFRTIKVSRFTPAGAVLTIKKTAKQRSTLLNVIWVGALFCAKFCQRAAWGGVGTKDGHSGLLLWPPEPCHKTRCCELSKLVGLEPWIVLKPILTPDGSLEVSMDTPKESQTKSH